MDRWFSRPSMGHRSSLPQFSLTNAIYHSPSRHTHTHTHTHTLSLSFSSLLHSLSLSPFLCASLSLSLSPFLCASLSLSLSHTHTHAHTRTHTLSSYL